tara:strand:+ start:3739 stop:4170 length:432 start_codon:yes stop_codon:yes gene_type:complete
MNKTELIGTWDLQRFWFHDEAGVEVDPLGTDPVGNLVLGADGYYAFTMMRTGRTAYESGDILGGTAAEKGEAADGYVSFGGAWSFDGEAITFAIAYSLFPNWVGGTQKRLVSFADGELLLQTTVPILMAGKTHRGAARWRKLG